MKRLLVALTAAVSAVSLFAQAPAPAPATTQIQPAPVAPAPVTPSLEAPSTGETKPPADAPAKKKRPAPSTLPFRGKVEAVDAKAMTVTLAGKEKQRVFNVTSKTRFEKDGKPATFGDVQAGDDFRGSYAHTKDGDNLVRALIGAAPAKPAAAKKPAKKADAATEQK